MALNQNKAMHRPCGVEKQRKALQAELETLQLEFTILTLLSWGLAQITFFMYGMGVIIPISWNY